MLGVQARPVPSTSSRSQTKTRPAIYRRGAVKVQARAARYDSRKPPPPDLPSLLFDQRIVYLGMPLVPAVTELIVAELLYLEKQGATLPIEMLINSSGTTRQDGEILAFESEGIAITSTMGFVKNPISTVNMGLAVGWSAAVLAFGKKGWRKSLPHSLTMIQQPRVPPTGQRQAIEVHIKWREVLNFKRELLRMLSIGTGWPVEKLDADMQRPLYMRPRDAVAYGLIDEVIQPNAAKATKAAQYWLKSGRAESDGRLEDWAEHFELQEERALRDNVRKAHAQEVRAAYRATAQRLTSGTKAVQGAAEELRRRLPADMVTPEGEVLLPMSREGIRVAVLNAERYADRAVERQVKAGRVQVPERWEQEAKEMADLAAMQGNEMPEDTTDYEALIRAVDAMDPDTFARTDIEALMAQYRR